MFILDSFREADNDELYCHVCQLPFTNTSSKQAHFCGRPHSAEVIKKIFSVLGCSNRVRRGRRGKAIQLTAGKEKDPGVTCDLASLNHSAITSETSMPHQVDIATNTARIPVPPPVHGLRSSRERCKVIDSTGTSNSGLRLEEKQGLQPSFLSHCQAGQDVPDELGRVVPALSPNSFPYGTASETSCLLTGSNPTLAGGTEHLSLMDIVTVTDQLLIEGLSQMDGFGTVGREEHSSQPLAGVSGEWPLLAMFMFCISVLC